mmetsp:Transcript_93560/g.166451  ORF Transcript_93560/g.166451 Transcript_93560/m.166451 type:complete len:342 (-) Transcript_93560:230-1255(-)|eukprot:CAMPEP_0197643106 /NCGR_PEP_ID=MMETSP1338-20131121/16551_1 /TAXON_ID=43686 ORGANISM="Pelagodinium beii, Strain RCC1491" /NCGR_SAMPLE_ID=MMETSP1338 /ASSEMBLY_ACC=CAM_ASM_000754 /LENGTH=341 /DNA_ID=CAMNT_0043216325 /DNA_START=46 /DNA_END=1071 /DNA_ORIENTATION=-
MVPGVRVHGPDARDAEVKLDETFRQVPVPTRLGVPLLYKIQSGTGGDDSSIRSNAIVRFMSDPDDGFAPDEWQYGGSRGPAPPVVLARKDQLPFSTHDWDLVNEYMSEWMEECGEAEENRKEMSDSFLNPSAFQRYVRSKPEEHPLAFLSMQFPLGCTVIAEGLSVQELNGKEGTVKQYSRERVGVQFRDRPVTALKPERLKLLCEAPEPEPPAKRQDVRNEKQRKEARWQDLERQEALQICRRFVQCLNEDQYPEMGDLHLFGIGNDYQQRNMEVLAVWQGLVKHKDFTAENIAEEMVKGCLQRRFEELTEQLAESRTPNSTYAKDLLAANFAATEWDEL